MSTPHSLLALCLEYIYPAFLFPVSVTASGFFLSICELNIFCSLFACLFWTRRSSSIRPGQFGYGRVPFSLPLHRQNRQARHTINGTDSAPELADENHRNEEEEVGVDEEDEDAGRREDEERHAEQGPTDVPSAGEESTASPRRHVARPSHTHTERERARVPPSHAFSRSSSPSVPSNRHRFDWHSLNAPPPPVHSRPHSPAVASSPFSSPLHRPVLRDREPHPSFNPQAPPPGNVYPLQQPHVSHLGVQSGRDGGGGGGAPRVYRCSGPEKEYRRCFSQVRHRG